MAEPVTEMMKQSIIVSDSVPELDGKINQIKTEISWKIQKILGFLEKEDGKKGSVGGLIEYFRNECVPTYKHVDKYFLRKEDHEISDDSQKNKWELNAVVQKLSVSEVTLLTRVVDDTKQSFKNQAASQAEALTIQEKLDVLDFLKEEADATIAKQRAEISKLTEELTRARNLKLELDKIDEKNLKACKKLVDQVENRKKDLKSTKEEASKVMKILQLKEAQEKMVSKVGEEINETIRGMDSLSVKFEVEFGLLVSGIYEIGNEVKVVMKWIGGSKSKQDELKQEIARLVEELKEEKDEMEVMQKPVRRLTQSVKRGEEKIGELEKMIAEKNEQMRELETKISERESTILNLVGILESAISTAITKIK